MNSELQLLALRKYQVKLELEEIEEQLELKRNPFLHYVNGAFTIPYTKKGLTNLLLFFFSLSVYHLDNELSQFFGSVSLISFISYLYQLEKYKRKNTPKYSIEELEYKRQKLNLQKELLNEKINHTYQK